jgi:Ca2+-binding RTX toxin-like protein
VRRLAPLACLMVLAAPAAAPAAEVRSKVDLQYSKLGDYLSAVVVFQAARGEANRVELEPRPAAGPVTVVLHDVGAPVQAGPGCHAAGAHTVRCATGAEHVQLVLDAGDGDDEVSAPWGTVDGGGGADTLSGRQLDGGAGDDRLVGTTDSDQLDGGGGADTLLGGDGADRLKDGDDPGAPDADSLDGGPGRDAVSYEGRTAGVTLRLPGGAGQGQAGEGDALAGIEEAAGGDGPDVMTAARVPSGLAGTLYGGPGDDRVVGGPARDYLSGGTGRDVVEGGAGADRLHGLEGADLLRGGPGDDVLGGEVGEDGLDGGDGDDRLDGGQQADRLSGGSGGDLVTTALDHFADRATCGSGRDRGDADPRDRLTGCERVGRRRSRPPRLLRSRVDRIAPVLQVRRGRARIRANCDGLSIVCAGRVTVRATGPSAAFVAARGRFVCGHAPYPVGTCAFGDVNVELTAAGHRALRRRGRLRATAVIRLAPGRGAIPLREPLTLVAPGHQNTAR